MKPDIDHAETVSKSIQCGNNLEEAMAKRDLEGILTSVDAIKTNGFEQDHAQQLLEADKLANKLKRLEKLKKDILALDQRTISEIRSYKKPLPAIHDVMIATYIILGYKEKELKVDSINITGSMNPVRFFLKIRICMSKVSLLLSCFVKFYIVFDSLWSKVLFAAH